MQAHDPGAITIELIGGLGNQLFQYATGLSQAQRLGCPLDLDVTYFTVSDKRDVGLRSFNHSGKFVNVPQKSKARWIQRRPRADPSVLREASYLFDPRVCEVRPGTRLEGYFQSWRYFEDVSYLVREQVRNLRLPSVWYLEMLEHLQGTPWIGVHMRRGDYTTDRYRNTFGPISVEYVDRGLRFLRREADSLPTLVFSDEPGVVIQELREVGLDNVADSVIEPPPGTDPIESMLLLSTAAHLLLSNSSFSWWAAYLGHRPGRLVVAPRPWFLGLDHDTRDLLLPEWLTLDSRAFTT